MAADAETFEKVVSEYYAPLYRFAMSLTRAEAEACDLVQDAFAVWAAKGHQLRDASKARAWLFTTLHRRFLETQRRITRLPHVELQEAEAELPHVESQAVNVLAGSELLEILGKIDPQYQAAVSLFYLEDYSYPEIAEILEVPLGTVKSRISRGLVQLRALLGSDPGFQLEGNP